SGREKPERDQAVIRSCGALLHQTPSAFRSEPPVSDASSTVLPGTPSAKVANGTCQAARFASATAILAQAQAGRSVIQDYVPLADSIEWELGQRYWRERGSHAFLGDAVPFVINNDGQFSRHAAAVFFANVQAADAAGTLEPELFVLELG